MVEGGENFRRATSVSTASRHVVYSRVRRPDASLALRASKLPVSDIYEALPDRAAVLMSPRMRPVIAGKRIAGPAVTAQSAAGDNLMMHKALLLAEAGDVLVVAAAEPAGAQWGSLAAVYARHKGLAGVVVHGPVRDIEDIVANDFPVWSTSISPAHPEKQAAGSVNAPIECDGVVVRPGDIVCADDDGVVVIPRDSAAEVIAKAEQRVVKEKEITAAILRGETLFDLHDIASEFARSGVREIDAVWDDG